MTNLYESYNKSIDICKNDNNLFDLYNQIINPNLLINESEFKGNLSKFLPVIEKINTLKDVNQDNADLYNELSQIKESLIEVICNNRSQAKGKIVGEAFNKLIAKILFLNGFSVKTECKIDEFTELLDVHAIKGDLELIIFCQMDLWNGGHQTNRCRNYLNPKKLEMHNQKQYKYICIVFNEYSYRNNNSKKTQKNADHDIILNAYENKNLMWINDLIDFIN